MAEHVTTQTGFVLRPGIINPVLWLPIRPPKQEWDRIRLPVLQRDDYTCKSCGHRALRYMHVHHLQDPNDNKPENLITLCVACHAVLHVGLSLDRHIVEIWESDIPQVQIVQLTREGIRKGLSLAQVKKGFRLKRGPRPPASSLYARDLLDKIGSAPRAYLPTPLCVVFVNLTRWQLE